MTRTEIIIIVCFLVVAVVGTYMISKAFERRANDRCIGVQPLELLSGYIDAPTGIVSEGAPRYWLTYRGTRKLSGETCKARCRVTEAEYERRMYGKDE